MTVRETYMKDYLITDCRKKELVQFCRNADNEDLIMILQAAIQSNSGLGHSSLAMTMDLYSHVLPDTKADEMQKIANVF